MAIADYDAVLALWRRSEGVGLGGSDTRLRIAAYLGRNPGLSYVARSRAGRIVGAVLCGHDGRRGYLNHLAVDRRYRRRGIGRQLVAACLAGLQAAGIRKCNLVLFRTNTAGRAFWERGGWIQRTDLHCLQKLIPRAPRESGHLRGPVPAARWPVRRATMADVTRLCRLDRLARIDAARRRFIRQNVSNRQCFVVLARRRIAGYAVLEYSFYGNGFVAMLCVDADHRRAGIGTALLRHLERQCRTPKLFTSTNRSNRPMQRLLKKLGYVRCGSIDQLDPGDPEWVYCRDVLRRPGPRPRARGSRR